MMGKSIWVVSLFEPTPVDNTRPMRSMSIAAAANAKGIEVHHFACTFRHATKVERFKVNKAQVINDLYTVHYVYGSPYTRNTSLARFTSHKEFTNNLLKYIDDLNLQPPVVILVASPPMSTIRKLADWGKLKAVPVIMDIIDPWPDVFLRFVPSSTRPFVKMLMFPMYIKLNKILRNVSGVTAISKEYINWAKNKGIHIANSDYFYPSVPVKLLQKRISEITPREDKEDKIRLIYAGNLGIAYDIPIILDVAEKLDSLYPRRTEFIICGVGYYENDVKTMVNKLDNIKFKGRLNYADLLQEYANSHVGLAQYKKGATQSVTYKLFDYLACGLPVLNSLPTEMAVIIEENYVGYNNLPNQPEVLLENIIKYIETPGIIEDQKNNAITLSYEQGDNDKVYGKMVDFLTTLKSV